MKKAIFLFFTLIFLTSCFNKNEDKITDDINDIENIGTLTGTFQDEISEDIDFFEISQEIEKIPFKEENVKKIDSFFVDYKNASFGTGETFGDLGDRQFENLKVEIKGQLPMLIDKIRDLTQAGNGGLSPIFLSTANGLEFERLVLILNDFDFKKDFEGVEHYDLDLQQENFNIYKEEYLRLKEGFLIMKENENTLEENQDKEDSQTGVLDNN